MDQPPDPDAQKLHRRRTFAFLLTAVGIICLITVVALIVDATRSTRHPAPEPSSAATVVSVPSLSWSPSPPALPDDVKISWAYIDSTEGELRQGGDTALHPLDRLIVPGAAAARLDHLRQDDASPPAEDSLLLSAALSQNDAAGDAVLTAAGGPDTAFTKLIDTCQLKDVTTGPPAATALEVARYAACLREGAITDPETSAWVLDQMRPTAGGIGDVRGNDGGQRLAQFNATAKADDDWMRTGCMAVGAYWSAGVFVTWPTDRGELYGPAACAEVARTEFPPDTQQAPDSPAPAEPSSTCPYETCRGTE